MIPKTGAFTPRGPKENWDVDTFDIAPDGSFIAYVTNEAGMAKLKLLDPKTDKVRVVDTLPAGIVGGLEISEWGEIGLTFTSARSAADAFSIDPKTLKLTRWTESETGGLDVTKNSEPELVKIKSFDGLEVSGFLYRPDPAKFPGKRPLIMSVHGGPEAQSRPGFQGRSNYMLNEEGVALFYPNVRGSTGYGKKFVGLDNGPSKREDSVKDMGAFIDALAKDKGLDANRFGLTGGLLWWLYVLCSSSAIWRQAARDQLHSGDLQLRHFSGKHAKLQARPAPRGIWRRARSQTAGETDCYFAAHPGERDQEADDGGNRRQ